jgi:hypothetical protein
VPPPLPATDTSALLVRSWRFRQVWACRSLTKPTCGSLLVLVCRPSSIKRGGSGLACPSPGAGPPKIGTASPGARASWVFAAARDAGVGWGVGTWNPGRKERPPGRPRARSPRWEPGMGMIPDPRQIESGMGMGVDPRSPANRGWGWGWTPDCRRVPSSCT